MDRAPWSVQLLQTWRPVSVSGGLYQADDLAELFLAFGVGIWKRNAKEKKCKKQKNLKAALETI